MADRLRWLPNALTVSRLAALPVLLWVMLTAEGPTSLAAAAIYGAVAITDLLDGALARRMGAESRFGRIADPLADRLLVAVGLLGLIALGRFAWPGPTIILVRDALSVAGFVLLARRGVAMRVDLAGKVSSAWNMVATGLALLTARTGVGVVFWIGVALSVVTFANYARSARAALRSTRAEPATSASTSA